MASHRYPDRVGQGLSRTGGGRLPAARVRRGRRPDEQAVQWRSLDIAGTAWQPREDAPAGGSVVHAEVHIPRAMVYRRAAARRLHLHHHTRRHHREHGHHAAARRPGPMPHHHQTPDRGNKPTATTRSAPQRQATAVLRSTGSCCSTLVNPRRSTTPTATMAATESAARSLAASGTGMPRRPGRLPRR
jgi:hypothetical protein